MCAPLPMPRHAVLPSSIHSLSAPLDLPFGWKVYLHEKKG